MTAKNTVVFVDVGITPLLVSGTVLAEPAGDVVAVPPEAAVRSATDIGFSPVRGSDCQPTVIQLQCRCKAVSICSGEPETKDLEVDCHD